MKTQDEINHAVKNLVSSLESTLKAIADAVAESLRHTLSSNGEWVGNGVAINVFTNDCYVQIIESLSIEDVMDISLHGAKFKSNGMDIGVSINNKPNVTTGVAEIDENCVFSDEDSELPNFSFIIEKIL